MANCNCYRCTNSCAPTNCTNECVCTDPDYSSLGCIENKTECIIYNGPNIPELNTVKNEDLNAILQHIKDKVVILNDLIIDLQDQLDAIDARVTLLEP